MPGRYTILMLTAILGLGGCRCCERPNCVAARPYWAQRYPEFPQPPRMTPMPRTPAPAAFVPPNYPPPPAALEPPLAAPPPPASSGSTELGMAPAAESPPPGVRLGPPGPIRRESAAIPPENSTREPPLANVPGEPPPRAAEKRELDKDAQAAIDLPGFAIAIPGVATGLKPFPDGVTLLAEKGYKTVLHLHGPEEKDLTAAQKLYERKGLRYLNLEVSPARLTKDLYDKFVAYVKDPANHPLYVFDKEGAVAGGLWYLYIRVELGQSDERARAEAQRLGLSFDEDRAEHRAMVLAVQKLRETLKP